MPESVLVDLGFASEDYLGVIVPDSQLIPVVHEVEDYLGVVVPDTVLFGEIAPGGAPAPTVNYYMAVWNTTNGEWVRWVSPDAPDPNGASYPGPGTFGVDTQTPAIVERVVT